METRYEKLYRKLNVTPTKQRVDLAHLIFAKKQHFTATDLINLADKKKTEYLDGYCLQYIISFGGQRNAKNY